MAEFNNDAGEVTESDILSAFGISSEEPEGSENNTPDDNGAPNPDTDPSGGSEEGSNDTPPAEGHPAQSEPPAQQTPAPDNKQNQAFARMRTENAQYQRTIAKMAEVLGVDPRLSPEQLSEQLNARATEALAKKQGIDPALAQRLEKLEDVNRRYEEQQLSSKLETQFREIQTKFGATPEQVTAFANDLVQAGFNNSNVGATDLVSLYIRTHFDELVKARVDEAVAKEQARSSKAGDASQPGKKSAPAENKEEKTIDSVSELESLFGELT